jgi:hypothetical protein
MHTSSSHRISSHPNPRPSFHVPRKKPINVSNINRNLSPLPSFIVILHFHAYVAISSFTMLPPFPTPQPIASPTCTSCCSCDCCCCAWGCDDAMSIGKLDDVNDGGGIEVMTLLGSLSDWVSTSGPLFFSFSFSFSFSLSFSF